MRPPSRLEADRDAGGPDAEGGAHPRGAGAGGTASHLEHPDLLPSTGCAGLQPQNTRRRRGGEHQPGCPAPSGSAPGVLRDRRVPGSHPRGRGVCWSPGSGGPVTCGVAEEPLALGGPAERTLEPPPRPAAVLALRGRDGQAPLLLQGQVAVGVGVCTWGGRSAVGGQRRAQR